MMLRIARLLDESALATLHGTFADPALFVDGRRTAGWHARAVKHNLQARRTGPVAAALKTIERALLANDVFVAAARPKSIVRLMVSRYEPGMTYGSHVDDALMGGVRTDLSLTLFLADPSATALPAWIFAYRYLPETRGKSLEEIVAHWHRPVSGSAPAASLR
jgi:PKHD-type hydroxylase